MKTINGDIYVMYYEPGAQSIEALKAMYDEAKKAVAPKPIIALPTNVSLKGISKQELLDIIAKALCEGKEDILESVLKDDEAKWEIWGGWVGNCNKRIDDATCSKCGYHHATVYGDPKHLSLYCAGCGRKMIGVVEKD